MLEARDRIGGQLHTVDLAGSPVDLGGSWIHMPGGGTRCVPSRSRSAVPLRSADPVPEMAGLTAARAAARQPPRPRRSRLQSRGLPGGGLTRWPPSSARMRPRRTGSRRSWPRPAWPRARRGGRARRCARLIEAESADLAERQSLRWMWNEIEYDGNYFGDVPDGGYRRLVDAMATGADLRAGRGGGRGRAFAQDGVRVRCADGTSEEGSHVVVTVPLGVLKRGAPRFSPALPPDRLAAIGRLGFGRFEKVALRFDEPFWRAAGFPHLMVFPRDPGSRMVWVVGLDAFAPCARRWSSCLPQRG